jgi:hypothetical protein
MVEGLHKTRMEAPLIFARCEAFPSVLDNGNCSPGLSGNADISKTKKKAVTRRGKLNFLIVGTRLLSIKNSIAVFKSEYKNKAWHRLLTPGFMIFFPPFSPLRRESG